LEGLNIEVRKEAGMLCVSRQEDEFLVADLREHGLGVIRFGIVGIVGGKVKIGVDADKSIPVHREEVFEAIERQKRRDGDHV
jgi:carbon storage regulator